MKNFTILICTVAIIVGLLGTANALSFQPTFSEYAFNRSQYNVDDTANAYYRANYGINIDNAYLYRDQRDSFDRMGISVGNLGGINSRQTGTITFLDTTRFVSIDYWGIRETSFCAYDIHGTLIDTFTVGPNMLGTYEFDSDRDGISYLTWSSYGGFGQISNLRYEFDGFTDGRNHHDCGPSPVPEPATILLLGSGVVGLVGTNRKRLTPRR